MDDYLDSFNDLTTAVSTILSVSKLLKDGGFHLTKWTSKSIDILNTLPKDDISPKVTNLDLVDLPIERTLGKMWDPKSDQITVQSLSKEFEDTKRGLLSCVSSIFDPLGIVNPALLEAKLLIQELWQRKLEWDDKLPIDLLERWIKWKSSLNKLDMIQIPRWYGFIQAPNSNLQLHVFCDASRKAYGCVCYFRFKDKEGKKCSFICGKSRLAPISKNTLTIPRLELQAAVLATRMKVAIFDSVTVKINKVFMWSDSKTVLQYIRNENVKYPTYVMHRVSEIKKNTDVSSWNYIPGVLNVADDATRVTNFQNLNEHCRWFNGPEFLVDDESEWPKETFDKSVENASTSINQVNISPQYQSFINWNYYSNFYKLIYHVASLLKLKRHWTKRHRNQPSNVNFNIFTVKEIEESINVIVCESQKEYYPREFNSLPMTKLVSKDSKLLSLHPLLIDNIIRVGGRNKHANVPFNQKHQMIIHKNHPLSKLVIKHTHESNFHCGREQTLSILRNKYWIPNVRGLIRKIITDCLHSRKVSATPSPSFMADITEERLQHNHKPFTNTGTDYFGPFHVKLSKATRSNAAKGKRYGVILTCMPTCACAFRDIE